MGLLAKMGHGVAYTAETVVKETALPAALLSTAHSGNYLERGLGGFKTAYDAVSGGVQAYVSNDTFRDTMNAFGTGVLQTVGDVATNVSNDGEQVLYAMIGTYVAAKVVPTVTRYARRNLTVKEKAVPKPASK